VLILALRLIRWTSNNKNRKNSLVRSVSSSCTTQTYPRFDTRLYTLELVTHEFMNSLSSRMSRRFSSMTCQEAVRKSSERLGCQHRIACKTDEETFGKVDVVIPNYTPLKAINYFTLLAQTVKQPRESNFLFFETLGRLPLYEHTSAHSKRLDAPAKVSSRSM
jgi:hypothetical protein